MYRFLPVGLLLANAFWTSLAQPAHALSLRFRVNPDGTPDSLALMGKRRFLDSATENLPDTAQPSQGDINTPLELAINNNIDRFSLAMDVIDRVPMLQATGTHAKEKFKNMQIQCRQYAYEHGIDQPEVINWRWNL